MSHLPISGHVVARMLRVRAIAAQIRHRDISVLVNRYIRPVEGLATPQVAILGCEGSGSRSLDTPVIPHQLTLPIIGRYLLVMRSDGPALMPVFRSQHQAELLTWLMLHPEQE